MKIIFSALLLLTTVATSMAATKTVTFFSDGALVEMVHGAVKGVVEIPLPGDMQEGTLRITPLNGVEIRNVEILAIRQGEKREKELELLREQKSRLEDRLQALATREEIFKSAAKSQSGKAPRKTKANPEPMQSIRQGTDYAIAQLEAVYTAKRRSRQEIERLNARITELGKGTAGAQSMAKVILSTANGKVKTGYALAGNGWKPGYDLRLGNSGSGLLTLFGHVKDASGGAQIAASPGRLADSAGVAAVPATMAGVVRLAQYRLPVTEELFSQVVGSAFSCTLTNTGSTYLPAGTAAIYHQGEYRGQVRFDGISSGRSRKISSQKSE